MMRNLFSLFAILAVLSGCDEEEEFRRFEIQQSNRLLVITIEGDLIRIESSKHSCIVSPEVKESDVIGYLSSVTMERIVHRGVESIFMQMETNDSAIKFVRCDQKVFFDSRPSKGTIIEISPHADDFIEYSQSRGWL